MSNKNINENIFEFYDEIKEKGGGGRGRGEDEIEEDEIEEDEAEEKDNPGIVRANEYSYKELMVRDNSKEIEDDKAKEGKPNISEKEIKKAGNEGGKFNCRIAMLEHLAKGNAEGGRITEDHYDKTMSHIESRIAEGEMLSPEAKELSDSMPVIDGGEKKEDKED